MKPSVSLLPVSYQFGTLIFSSKPIFYTQSQDIIINTLGPVGLAEWTLGVLCLSFKKEWVLVTHICSALELDIHVVLGVLGHYSSLLVFFYQNSAEVIHLRDVPLFHFVNFHISVLLPPHASQNPLSSDYECHRKKRWAVVQVKKGWSCEFVQDQFLLCHHYSQNDLVEIQK